MVGWYWILIAFIGGIFTTIIIISAVVGLQDDEDAKEKYKRLKGHEE